MGIVVGTSSWADPGFVEEWYPPSLPARDRLAWYADRFEAVEVNSTFYAVPEARTVGRWVEQTPDGFTFDWKLHRALSRHSATPDSLPPDLRGDLDVTPRGRVRLTAELEAALVDRTIEAIAPLEESGRLAALLLQLTPGFRPDRHRLAELEPLVQRFAPRPVAVELRHRGWVDPDRLEETLGWFERVGVAFVCVDAPDVRAPTAMPPVDAATHPELAYLRAHGRNAEGYVRGRSVAERFGWQYSDPELEEIAERAEGLAQEVPTVRMMFNNNRGADAPRAAERMRELLGQTAHAASG